MTSNYKTNTVYLNQNQMSSNDNCNGYIALIDNKCMRTIY